MADNDFDEKVSSQPESSNFDHDFEQLDPYAAPPSQDDVVSSSAFAQEQAEEDLYSASPINTSEAEPKLVSFDEEKPAPAPVKTAPAEPDSSSRLAKKDECQSSCARDSWFQNIDPRVARTTFATALTGSEDHSSSYPNIPDLYESREASHSTNYSFLPSQKSVEKDTEYRYKFRDKSFSPDFKSSSPKSQFFERETAKYFKLLSEERKSLERVVRQNSASRPLIIDCSPRVSFEMADSPVNVERKNEDVCPDLSDDSDRQAEIDMQADKAVTGVLIPEARDDGVNVCSDTEAQSPSAVLSSDSLGVKHDEMTVTESLGVSENESDSHVKDSIVAHDNVPEDSKDFSTDLTVEKLGEEVPAPAASSDDQQKAVDSVEQIGTEIESPEQRETVPDSDLNEDNKAVIVEEPTDPEKVVDSETSETSSGTSWEFVAGDTADSPVPFTQADGLQQPQRPDAQTDLLTEDTELGLSTDTVTPEDELQHSAILMTSGAQKDGESPTKILPSEPHEEANIESDTRNTPDVVSAHVVTPMEEDIWDEGNVPDEIKPDAEPEGQSDEGILLDSSLADDDAKPADLELIGDETPATRQQITEGSPLETIPTEDISETQPELTPDEQLVSETNQDYQTIDEDPDKTQKSVDYLSKEQKAEEELYDLGRNLTEEYRQHQQILPEDEPVLDLQPAVENEVAEDDRFAAEEKLELPKGDVIQSLQEDNEFAQNVSENTATGSLLDHYGDSGCDAYTAEEEPYEVETPAGIRATDSIEEEGDFEQELGLSLESDVHESLQELETALSAHQVASHPHHQMELAEEDQDDMITDPYEEYVSRSRNTSVDQTAAMRDDLIYQEQMLSLQDNMATSEEDLPTEVEEYKMMQQSAELSSPEVTVRDSESPPHSLAPTTVTKEGSRSLAEIQQEVKLKTADLVPTFVVELIYWRDVKKSAIALSSLLLFLISLATFSVLSVVAYVSLALLTVTISFRIYKNVLQAVQKSSDGHPFKQYLSVDISIPSEKTQEVADILSKHAVCMAKELRRLFLVEDLVDSVKFGLLLWVMTYIGAWFNGMTLIILGLVAVFTLPKVYETYKVQIDQYLDIVRTQVRTVMKTVQEKIPMPGKKKAQ